MPTIFSHKGKLSPFLGKGVSPITPQKGKVSPSLNTLAQADSGYQGVSVNVGGAWKSVIGCQVNVNGTWKTVAQVDVNVNGTWKTVFM